MGNANGNRGEFSQGSVDPACHKIKNQNGHGAPMGERRFTIVEKPRPVVPDPRRTRRVRDPSLGPRGVSSGYALCAYRLQSQ